MILGAIALRSEIPACARKVPRERAVQETWRLLCLTIQAISSHPLQVRAVEEILADVKEYPYPPSAPNGGEAASRTNLTRPFLWIRVP